MEQERTCKTCKHWAGMGLKHPQATQRGLCRALCILPGVVGPELYAAGPDTLGRQHPTTPQDHACNMWEAGND